MDLSPGPKIHYLDLNPQAEKVVMLLHGLGANGSSWQLQFPALTEIGYRIIAPDARGFGQSTYPPDSPALIEATAQDFIQLAERLTVSCLDLVGISLGGTHALALALSCPELVRRLVLVNTFAHLRPHGLSQWIYYASRFVLVHTLGLETQARAVVPRILPRSDQQELREIFISQIMQSDLAAYRSAMRALARFNVLRRLSEIKIPTLIITAENDTTVPMDVQQQLVNGIQGAYQVVIPAAGHAVSVDQPEVFNQVLTGFLSGKAGQA